MASNLQKWIDTQRKKKKDTKKTHFSEIHYESYQRSFTLPGNVDEKKVDAKFENGVLILTVSKNETSKMKQIPVH